MTLNFGAVLPYLPVMFMGLALAIFVSVGSMLAGSVLGVFAYLAKVGKSRVLRAVSSAYIEVMRNSPLLVQIYLIYFGLGQAGIQVSPLWSALIAMTLNNGAYTAEIFRAGFDAVPAGLREAADALGMNQRQTFVHVVLMPGIRNIIPALTNQFILLFLFSSVASVVSLNELTYELLQANSQSQRTIEVFAIGALLYYGTSAVLAGGSRFAEVKFFRW
ncbi:MAG: amino acid ABC transporter permease [Acidimicrobiia bacterium]